MKEIKGKAKTETVILIVSIFLVLSLIVASVFLIRFLAKKIGSVAIGEEVTKEANIKFDIKGYEDLGIGGAK